MLAAREDLTKLKGLLTFRATDFQIIGTREVVEVKEREADAVFYGDVEVEGARTDPMDKREVVEEVEERDADAVYHGDWG